MSRTPISDVHRHEDGTVHAHYVWDERDHASDYGGIDEATTRLIAAAPDLLAALEDAPPPIIHSGEYFRWYGRRSAAIAKAKGES